MWSQPTAPIFLHSDSQASIFGAYSKMFNGKSIHVSFRHGYVRQLIVDGIITIIDVKSYNNLSDPFSKELSKDLIKNTSARL